MLDVRLNDLESSLKSLLLTTQFRLYSLPYELPLSWSHAVNMQ